MDDSKRIKILVAVGIWLVVIGFSFVAYNKTIAPTLAKRHREKVLEDTSSDRHFKTELNILVDEFSGYAIWRSQEFRDECSAFGIKINVSNDSSYVSRLKRMQSGEVQIALFSLDSLIKTSSLLDDVPATVVTILDETTGADAIIASKSAFPNIDSLNDPDVKFVCVKDSPSETFVRIIHKHYKLPPLSEQRFEFCNSIDDVYKKYQSTPPNSKKVYVLWEPYVSKISQHPDYHVIIDSSKFRGYMVDVATAQRDYLVKNQEVVQNVFRAYYKTLFNYRDNLAKILQEDAKILGQPLTDEQCGKLTSTIWFKNTLEAYSHFGLDDKKLQHIESMIINLTDVLQKTSAIPSDPTGGNPNKLYYVGLLESIKDSGFNPGLEIVREQKELPALSEQDWASLRRSGTLEVPRLVFRRGSADVSIDDEITLENLAKTLSDWPQYYLTIVATSLDDNDTEIAQGNLELASRRSNAVVEFLKSAGVSPNRMKAKAVLGKTTTVEFTLGELPY